MILKRTLSIFLAVLMIGMTFTALPITVNAADVDTAGTAVDKTFTIKTADDLSAAVSEINAVTTESNYVIDLRTDLNGCGIAIQNEAKVKVTVTIIGNGHTLFTTSHTLVCVENGATVNLGDGNSTLTLQGDNKLHEDIDDDVPGLVDVWSNSTCVMRNKVTLKDRRGQNYLGGGVTVEGGTFIMDGGTIENCGIDGGSVCYGGGVAVFKRGFFEMNGGMIKDCYATSDYIDDYDPNRCFTAQGGGVFVADSSAFTMNGGTISNCEATNFGGGVAMDITYGESYPNRMGYPKSNATINGGTITGNRADCGGGVFASGYFYSYAGLFFGYQDIPAESVSSNPGLIINGGEITDNEANNMGGGILIAMLRSSIKAQIHNATIKKNTADNGAGIENFGYWTQMDIDGCTITGNTAVTNGGGVMLSTNTSGGYTNLKNTTVTGNTSGDRGAGVYYDNNSRLNISGANVIQNNTYNGVLNNLNILSLEKPVYVDGALTGSQIGLSDPTLWDDGKEDYDAEAVSTEYLTSGYKANNPEVHPSEYFTSDHETWIVDRSAKTTTTQPDPNSKTYREYKVKRYAAVLPNTAAYAGLRYQYVITDIQNPELTSVSSIDDILKELKYRFESSDEYTIDDRSNPTYGSTYITYTPKNSDCTASSIRIQKAPSKNEVTVTYNGKQPRGSYVTYTATPNIQSSYANSGELVLQITSNSSANLSNYTFSTDYTEETIKYVNADPPSDVIYEYDEYGDVTAKLEIGTYETKEATITVETGTEDEVRLVRKKPDYHINNDVIDDQYDNNDIFTSYVEAATKEIKVGETIDEFYTVPEVVPTAANSCPYIFKGWYYDQENDNDSHPVHFGTDKYAKDIYAHWIKVDNVTKDADDPSILPGGGNTYGGFDLAGVQIRRSMFDTNFGEITPGGMRFITSLSMNVVNQINAIKPNNIEYGYVATKYDGNSKSWIDYHDGHEKLQYVSDKANGINTTKTAEKNEDYFGFAHNVDCTSRYTNKNGLVELDHQNFGDYLLYSFVVTYEGEDAAGKDTKVLARSYIHYEDANGLDRVAYSDYSGNANKLGGCLISYNEITQ